MGSASSDGGRFVTDESSMDSEGPSSADESLTAALQQAFNTIASMGEEMKAMRETIDRLTATINEMAREAAAPPKDQGAAPQQPKTAAPKKKKASQPPKTSQPQEPAPPQSTPETTSAPPPTNDTGNEDADFIEVSYKRQRTASPKKTAEKKPRKEGPAPGPSRGASPTREAAVPERTPAQKPEERPRKAPTITVRQTEKWAQISAALKQTGFEKARNTAAGVVVYPSSEDDHKKIIAILTRNNWEYYTTALFEEKELKVVIRGLPTSTTTKDIAEDLLAKGYHPKLVHRMTSRRTKKQLPLFLVDLPKGDEKIYQETRCCFLVVRMEPLKRGTGPSQCYRCQWFHHSQKNCASTPRCVKCGECHRSYECTRPREEKATCANCGGDHPASYRGCCKMPRMPKKTAPPPPPRRAERAQPAKRATTALSYATAAAPQPQHPTNNSSNSNFMFQMAQIQKVQEEFLRNMMTTFSQFKPTTA